VPVDQTCAEKWPRNGAFSLWSLGPNLRWCRQRPCFWWHVFLQPCRALRFLLCKFVLPCFWTKSTTQRLLGTRHVGISWYCPLAGHMCHGFSTCYGLGIWSWSHHGTQSMGDDHPAIHPQMISNSVGNVGVSISQWLRDKAVTRQVNTHTHIYIYYIYIWLYMYMYTHMWMCCIQHNVAVCVRMGTSAPLCTAPFGGKFTIFQFTVQPRMSTPTSTRWNRVASENLRSDLSFSDWLQEESETMDFTVKKNGCIVFIESSLCWIQCLTRSLPVILWFLAFLPMISGSFPVLFTGLSYPTQVFPGTKILLKGVGKQAIWLPSGYLRYGKPWKTTIFY
jgi:hypothetical protein